MKETKKILIQKNLEHQELEAEMRPKKFWVIRKIQI